MEPMLAEFQTEIEEPRLRQPRRSRSSPTAPGRSLTDEQAHDPAYWVSHVRDAVRFADSVETLDEQGHHHLPGAGPRRRS